MTCAKQQVFCVLHCTNGTTIGENRCNTPQEVCPRSEGEDYTKCKTVCNQGSHAEIAALAEAITDGLNLDGAVAVLYGHDYYCPHCQEELYRNKVRFLSVSRGGRDEAMRDAGWFSKQEVR